MKLSDEAVRALIFIAAAVVVFSAKFAWDAFGAASTCEMMIDNRFSDCGFDSRLQYLMQYPAESVMAGLNALFIGLIAGVAAVFFTDKIKQ